VDSPVEETDTSKVLSMMEAAWDGTEEDAGWHMTVVGVHRQPVTDGT
jgi:hypothetical protein